MYPTGSRLPTKKSGKGKASASYGRGNGRRSYVPRGPATSAGTAVVYPNVFRGSGGYYDSSFVKRMSKALPAGSFEKAGSMVGGPIGGWAGSMLGKIAGFGDYSVSSNSLIGEGQSPAMMHSGSDITVVRHREYIMDIQSSVTPNGFQNVVYEIQPGLETSFPWLAPIAQQFEQYTVRGMVYEYKTLFADAIASSQANASIGGVIMATDYNVLNKPFANKQQMDNTQYTTSAKPSVSFYHPIECAPGSMPTNQLFIRSGAPTSGDLRLYDLAQFQIASFGIAASTVTLGELWCTYEIEFSKPIQNGFTANVLSDHYQLKVVSNAAALGAGTNSILVPGSSINGTIVAGQNYYFGQGIQDGNYLFVYSVLGASTAALQTASLVLTNCIVLTTWNADSSVAAVTAPGTTSSNLFMAFVIHVNSAGAIVSFNSPTLPTSITQGDLWVTEIDSDIVT